MDKTKVRPKNLKKPTRASNLDLTDNKKAKAEATVHIDVFGRHGIVPEKVPLNRARARLKQLAGVKGDKKWIMKNGEIIPVEGINSMPLKKNDTLMAINPANGG